MDIEIKIPQIEDLEAINNLAIQVHDCHVNWNPNFYLKCDQLISKEDLLEMLEKNSIFVAVYNGCIIGYISIIIKVREHKGFRYRKQLDIDSLCVDKEYRNRGVATTLLNYMKEFAVNQECTDIYLNVDPRNEAGIHLYEKFGMKVRNICYSLSI